MSRAIKFRAWEKRENRMITADEAKNEKSLLAVGFHGLPIAVDDGSFREGEIIGWNIDHRLELMQYTGLKDKNGKEIYEGDILKGLRNEYGLKIDEVKEVKYDEYMQLMPLHDIVGYDAELWMDESKYEIIGNIYENPELLEVKSHAQ